MKKLLAALLALLLCPPAWAGAEEWPDLTGTWVLTEIVYDGNTFRNDVKASPVLTLGERQLARYQEKNRLICGWWLQLSPTELLVTDLEDERFTFTVMEDRLWLRESGFTLSFSRVAPEPVAEEKTYAPLKNTGHVPGFDLVAASDVLELYAKPATGEVAFYDLRNGRTIWSNPQEADKDWVANKSDRERLKSQFVLDYSGKNGSTGSYSSFADSVDIGGLTAWTIPNGVAFGYRVFTPVDIYYVPHCLSDERYQELYDAAAPAVQRLMYGTNNSFYTQLDGGSWCITDNGRKMALRNLKKISDSFVAAGMTEEEYWSWQALAGIYPEEGRGFEIVLEWTLEGDTVMCCVPADSIVERGDLQLTAISLAPWLGAVQDMNGMSLYIEGRDETVTQAVDSISVALERFQTPVERAYYREIMWAGEAFPEWRCRQLAALSDDDGALVITAPMVELPAYFDIAAPGNDIQYGAVSYRLVMRELYRAEYSAYYWGDLIDVNVHYQLLDKPYQPETEQPATTGT